MIEIDIIILSYAKDDYLKGLTQQTIDTLLASEDPREIKFNVLVIESEKSIEPYQFRGSKTIYPKEKFGFNKYLNIGIKETSSPYLCLCNNDLIFHNEWATNISKVLKEDPEIVSSNPICPDFLPTKKLLGTNKVLIGNRKNIFNGILTGWCIFIRREIFDTIGFLDEQFEFWYADRDYGLTMLKFNIKHALVPNSIVKHIGNQSHNSIEAEKLNYLTTGQKKIFEQKWGRQRNKLNNSIKKVILTIMKLFK